ncbi:hypothetical protein [Photorhabdus bodei]|uniref:MFS transporter n=1 Tax=Photorhabdus bodei TaxID=2029681 RepID=A0AAW6BMF3_9GAMM|nr:hypothetical protein [Photorhabdus bodei]MDB6373848.1 hypothetical protein [Photorhabdus bodei]
MTQDNMQLMGYKITVPSLRFWFIVSLVFLAVCTMNAISIETLTSLFHHFLGVR